MEDKPVGMEAPKTKNSWKPVGIILIVIVFIMAAVMGFFVYKNMDQKTQIDDLNNKVKDLENKSSSSSDGTDSGDSTSDGDATATNFYSDTVKQLQAIFPVADSELGDTLTIDYYDNGYQGAVLRSGVNHEVGHAQALFYKTSSTADWKYFTVSQNVMSCDDFNTDDVRKAFADETCIGSSDAETTVSAYYGS